MTSPAPRRGEAATELREAIARAIRGAMIPGTMVGPDDDDYAAADAVLALPEVAELRSAWLRDLLTRGPQTNTVDGPADWYVSVSYLLDCCDAALASSSATEPESAS